MNNEDRGFKLCTSHRDQLPHDAISRATVSIFDILMTLEERQEAFNVIMNVIVTYMNANIKQSGQIEVWDFMGKMIRDALKENAKGEK